MAHPLHPALVHFPVACWSLATIGDLAGLAVHDPRVWFVSSVFLVIGLITALGAMSAGLLELRKIDEESAAMRIANWHMYLVVVTWVLYAFALLQRFNGANLIPPTGIAIGLSGTGFLLLCAAGWLGGALVYEHAIGVDRTNSPKG